MTTDFNQFIKRPDLTKDILYNYLGYVRGLINHAHYEHNLKLVSKGLPKNVSCPECECTGKKCVIKKQSKTVTGYYKGSRCNNKFMVSVSKNIKSLTSRPIFELIKI